MLMRKPYFTRQVGLVCLALSLVIGYFAPRTHAVSEDWIDAIRGLLLGLSIALLLVSLRRPTRP